jgi:hypothetical protein
MDRWLEKRAEAKERHKDWKTLSLNQQLDNLDKRLGKDIGAMKQRLRIKAHLILSNPTLKSNESKQYTDPKKQRYQRRKTKAKRQSKK